MATPYIGVVAYNTADGGTNGVTPTAGNSAGTSGNGFSPQITGSSTIIFSNANPIHGGMSYRITSNAGFATLRWLTATIGTLTNSCGVMYVRFESLPSGYTEVVTAYSDDAGGTGNKVFSIRVSSAGNVRLTDGAGTTVATSSSAPMSAGVVYRLEWQINHATGAYTVEWFLADDTEQMSAITGTGASLGANTKRIDFGRQASPELDITIDTIAVDTKKLGPRWVQGIQADPYSVVSNSGWMDQADSIQPAPILLALGDTDDATFAKTGPSPLTAALSLKMYPLSRTDIVTVTTRGKKSDSSDNINRTVKIFNGATELVSDTFALTTSWVNRATATPSAVAAGTELTVTISDAVA